MFKRSVLAALAAATLLAAAPAYADSCHDKGVATGSAVGGALGLAGVLTVGGILPGMFVGKAVSDHTEDNCLRERAAHRPAYHPQQGKWQDPDKRAATHKVPTKKKVAVQTSH